MKNKFVIFSGIGLIAGAAALSYFNQDPELNSNASTTPKSAGADNRLVKTASPQTNPNLAPKPKVALAPAHNKADIVNVMVDQSPLNPIERIKAIQNKTALHEAILNDHEQFTRYPEYNVRFDSEQRDPTVVRYELDQRTTENEEDHSSLTIWSDQKYYLQGDQVTVFASLRDANGAILPTQFIGQLIYNEQLGLQELDFQDEDKDGIYETRFDLVGNDQSMLEAGVYKVLIVNNTNQLADSVTFTLSKPDFELTGRYKDRILNGSLVIDAEVKVEQKNKFYIQASIYSERGEPVGSAQYSTELPQGKHWIPLSFDGLMIRDSGESGAFVLKNVSLAKVALPIQRAPLENPGFITQAYDTNQFRETPHNANSLAKLD